MKKSLFFILLFACSITMPAQSFVSNSDISKGWRQKKIIVKNGGQAPNIMTLLSAFSKAWPVWSVQQVLKHGAKLKDGDQYEDPDDWRVLVDRRNGFADLASQTDIDQVETCVWKCKNGHRVFAVSLYEQHDPVTNLLCWYDYDPKTQTLTPAQSPVETFKKSPGATLGWTLPIKGTDFYIYEYYQPGCPTLTHVYSWDGQQHHPDKVQIEDFRYQWFAEDEWYQASAQGYTEYALVHFDGEPYTMLCLRKPATSADPAVIREYTVFAPFKSDMQAVAILDAMHQFNGPFRVQPEEGAPWTGKEVVFYNNDFLHTNYCVVVNDGLVSYIVKCSPVVNEEGIREGHTEEINGFGCKDETVRIVHASVANELIFEPVWHPFEFTEADPG